MLFVFIEILELLLVVLLGCDFNVVENVICIDWDIGIVTCGFAGLLDCSCDFNVIENVICIGWDIGIVTCGFPGMLDCSCDFNVIEDVICIDWHFESLTCGCETYTLFLKHLLKKLGVHNVSWIPSCVWLIFLYIKKLLLIC